MERTAIAVAMGGESGEREISLRSGAAVCRALLEAGHEVRPLVVTADGRWRVGRRVLRDGEAFDAEGFPFETESPAAAVGRLRALGTGAVFVALHGRRGEDGLVQGLLEMERIPYTGPGVVSSAVAMDKGLTRAILRAAGIPVPEGIEESGRRFRAHPEEFRRRLRVAVGYPCFVKPLDEGSSLGVSRVAGPEGLTRAIEEALAFGPRFVVERAIEGPELTCAVLGSALDEDLLALPPVEIVPRHDGFFTMREKYDADGADEHCPPRTVAPAIVAKVREIAAETHRCLRCEGMSRVDFRLSEDGLPFVLEVNTIPGFTERSLLPKSAAAAGIAFPDLCARLVESAIRRFAPRPSPARA